MAVKVTINYYAVLEVTRTATAEEIKKSYRTLAKRYHPDVHPGDAASEQKFKECSEAYGVLGDAGKRATYDLQNPAPREAPKATSRTGRQRYTGFDISGEGDFSAYIDPDFQQQFMRSAFWKDQMNRAAAAAAQKTPPPPPPPPKPVQGRNKTVNRFVSLEKMVLGVEESSPFSFVFKCTACDGSGRVVTPSGSSVDCSACKGTGDIQKFETFTYAIKPGSRPGDRVILKGQGYAGTNGGENGDLVIGLGLEQHEFYRVEGDDLSYIMPVSLTQALLGATVRVPIIGGFHDLKLSVGTHNGQKYTIPGAGLPVATSDRHFSARPGDLMISIWVQMPVVLTDEQRIALEALDSTFPAVNEPVKNKVVTDAEQQNAQEKSKRDPLEPMRYRVVRNASWRRF